MPTGTVKFNTTKGFGCLQPDNGGKDVFVHISAVQKSGLESLYENDKVTFDLDNGDELDVHRITATLRRHPSGLIERIVSDIQKCLISTFLCRLRSA